jgi:ribosomal protein S18 acetylase RimI-like enzyme
MPDVPRPSRTYVAAMATHGSITEKDGSVELRPATPAEGRAIAAMLARSFETCPGWHWMLPPEAKARLERMERFFTALLGLYLGDKPNGRVCLTTDDHAGALLLDPPGGWKPGPADSARLLATMLPVFRTGIRRSIRAFSAFDAGHPSEPHWYLSVFGVDPRARRRGLADALLAEAIARSERDQVPLHAETGRPRSRDYYVRNGFDLVKEISLPDDGPPIWFVLRQPARQRSAGDARERLGVPAASAP